VRQIAADHLLGLLGQAATLGEHVGPVLHQPGVEVHARPGLADHDLGGEAHLELVLVGDLPHHPLGQGHLVGGLVGGGGQELDLVLHVLLAVDHEIADLGVRVLQRTTHLCQVVESLLPDLSPLREWRGLVVSALFNDRVEFLGRTEQVVFQLAEGFHRGAGRSAQRLLRLVEDVLRGAGQWIPGHVVERAQQVE